MRDLTSWLFWKNIIFRAIRTAIVIAIPYVPTLIADQNYVLVLSAAGFGALTSVVTNLISGIPEAGDTTVPWYYALLERVVKTGGQALLTAFGAATLFQDVDWTQVLPIVVTAVLGSALLGVMNFLPGADAPVAQATVQTPVTAIDGSTSNQAVPVVAAVPATTESTATATSDK